MACFLSLMHLVLALAVLLVTQAAPAAAEGGRTNVVLVGATGNLAKKYLFQALFDQSRTQPGLHVYPAATKGASVGQPMIHETLTGNVSCAKSISDCPTAWADFRSRVLPYAQLASEADWQALGERMAADNAGGSPEAGRLVYLSIPPSAYAASAQHVNKFLRPASGGWLRVIFEKPFGADSATAQRLADDLNAQLAEDEIYRVDHYLGKAGVQVRAAMVLRAWGAARL
jgi:glucose-6-phosphate 1-dehydrogenase